MGKFCPEKEERMGSSHRVWLLALFGLGLLLVGPPRARAVVVGNGSCGLDPDACDGNSGIIGTQSCNGDSACESNSGRIHNLACNGESACESNSGAVLNDSCTGDFACEDNSGAVGTGSCKGGRLRHQQRPGGQHLVHRGRGLLWVKSLFSCKS